MSGRVTLSGVEGHIVLDCSLRSRSLKELLISNIKPLRGLFYFLSSSYESRAFNDSAKNKKPCPEGKVNVVRVNDGIRTHDP